MNKRSFKYAWVLDKLYLISNPCETRDTLRGTQYHFEAAGYQELVPSLFYSSLCRVKEIFFISGQSFLNRPDLCG
ncbi:hypothetical protein SOVF_183720 [Spinacia oleracea]|nr:hypothetical protein SOVF_183720 [Spinacia oleracea]